MKKIYSLAVSIGLLLVGLQLRAQQVPAVDENIPFLVTFSMEADSAWGDDDNCQIFFFVVPETHKSPFFIRIFDPNVGGAHDENRGNFNSQTKFTMYGSGCYSNYSQRENKDPVGNYKRGNILFSKTFGAESTFDDAWFNFGPINPVEGQLREDLGGYVFKIIAQGGSGDDGNLYRYFMSTSNTANVPIEGGNAFTFEYSIRLHSTNQVSHIYPYIDNATIAVKQNNFDFDNDAYITIISMSNPGLRVPMSTEGNWVNSRMEMTDKDKNSSLDVQIIKKGKKGNNNVVFFITNQYGKFMPFYTIPIGVVPKKSIGVKPSGR